MALANLQGKPAGQQAAYLSDAHLWRRGDVCYSEGSDRTCEPPDIYRWKASQPQLPRGRSGSPAGTSDTLQEGCLFRSRCLIFLWKYIPNIFYLKQIQYSLFSKWKIRARSNLQLQFKFRHTKRRILCLFHVVLTYIILCVQPQGHQHLFRQPWSTPVWPPSLSGF